MPIILKSGSLNLLEPSRPVQACTGIALPLPFTSECIYFFIETKFLLKVYISLSPLYCCLSEISYKMQSLWTSITKFL